MIFYDNILGIGSFFLHMRKTSLNLMEKLTTEVMKNLGGA